MLILGKWFRKYQRGGFRIARGRAVGFWAVGARRFPVQTRTRLALLPLTSMPETAEGPPVSAKIPPRVTRQPAQRSAPLATPNRSINSPHAHHPLPIRAIREKKKKERDRERPRAMASKQQAERERKPEQMPTPPVQQQLQQFPQLPLPCPRCNSTNTKFSYFNNHSLLQPRYYCKDCKRFWTVGGALRNVPVGGRSRRNKSKESRRPRAVVQSAAPETMNNWLAAPVATAGLPGSAPALTSFLPSFPFGGGTGGIVPSGLELPDFDPKSIIEGCPASSVVSLPSLNPLFGGFNYQEQQQLPQLPGFGPARLLGMNPYPGMSLTGDGWLAPQPMNSPLISTVSTAVTVADTAPPAWEGSNAAEWVSSKEEGGGEDWKLYLSARGPDPSPSSSPVM